VLLEDCAVPRPLFHDFRGLGTQEVSIFEEHFYVNCPRIQGPNVFWDAH